MMAWTVAQRREVAAALNSDRVLAARFAALTTDLDALHKPGDIRAPEYLKHQWHDLVAREAQLERQKAGSPPRPFPWLGLGAAFTAVLALGVAIGVWMPRDTPTAGPQIVALEHPPVAGWALLQRPPAVPPSSVGCRFICRKARVNSPVWARTTAMSKTH